MDNDGQKKKPPEYKMPICWLGKTFSVTGRNVDGTPMEDLVITEEMVNMNCHCTTEREAFFCMEGHLTECHAGMLCEDAFCDHYRRQAASDPDGII